MSNRVRKKKLGGVVSQEWEAKGMWKLDAPPESAPSPSDAGLSQHLAFCTELFPEQMSLTEDSHVLAWTGGQCSDQLLLFSALGELHFSGSDTQCEGQLKLTWKQPLRLQLVLSNQYGDPCVCPLAYGPPEACISQIRSSGYGLLVQCGSNGRHAGFFHFVDYIAFFHHMAIAFYYI